jgi:16S rRNA U516 pseudouridylate synthase RsuA-like enzyme
MPKLPSDVPAIKKMKVEANNGRNRQIRRVHKGLGLVRM